MLIVSCSVILRMRNVSDKSCRENQNTNFVFSSIFPKISQFFLDNVETHSTAGQATDGNTEHADCVLDNQG